MLTAIEFGALGEILDTTRVKSYLRLLQATNYMTLSICTDVSICTPWRTEVSDHLD